MGTAKWDGYQGWDGYPEHWGGVLDDEDVDFATKRISSDIEESINDAMFDGGVTVRPRSVFSDGHYTIKLVD